MILLILSNGLYKIRISYCHQVTDEKLLPININSIFTSPIKHESPKQKHLYVILLPVNTFKFNHIKIP